MRRFLIINPFGIGDVLFTTPLIRNIKENKQESFIGYIANRRTAPLLESNSDVDKVHVYERDEFFSLYQRSKFKFFRKFQESLSSIRHENYDCVIDLSLNGNVSFLMCLAGIPRRVGFNFKNRCPLLTDKIPLSGYEDRPVAEYYLDILSHLGMTVHSRKLQLTVSPENHQWAADFIDAHAQSDHVLIAVVPGGGASWGQDAKYKRWPAAKFAELADKAAERFGCEIILLGDPSEEDLCLQVAGLMKQKVIQACGHTDLLQLAAVLSRCTLAVVNDGGVLHMAVAAGTKTVSIFGPVDEHVYGPYPPDGHRVVTAPVACRPCYRQFRRAACDHISCLGMIEVEEIIASMEELLTVNEKRDLPL